VVSDKGEPVEFSVAPASEADVKVFKELDLELPEGATIHADKGYTDYHYEDLLEEVGVKLLSQRKKRSKRPHSASKEFLAKPIRQYIETVFSKLSALFSRKIHAVTPKGFELKIVCFLLWPSRFNAFRGQLRLLYDRVTPCRYLYGRWSGALLRAVVSGAG
jgi:IS5 family transposase